LYSGSLLNITSVPDELAEHILASEYGWTLEYISRLPPRKFHALLSICQVKYRMEAVTKQREAATAAAKANLGA